MKKKIGLFSAILISALSINAQVTSKSGTGTGLDKGAASQVILNRVEKKLTPPGDNSSKYSVTPRKILTLSDGRKITVDLIRTPSTGTAPVVNKMVTANLPSEQQGGWTTEVKKTYLTAESTTFMNASNNNSINIVPGAIYTIQDFIGGANNEILGNRNPIRIYTDNQLKSNSTGGIVVNNPSGYEILQGNAGLNLNAIKNSIREGDAGARVIFKTYTANSEAELTVKVTAGGSYAGFTADGGYKLTQNGNKFYVTVDAIKPMYTIKAERPQNGFFSSSNNTLDKVYVKEVNYGSRVLANVEIVLSDREDIVNFKADYAGTFKANGTMDYINKTKNKSEKVNGYLIGVPRDARIVFNKDKLEQEILALLSTCDFQHAQPISYSLGDMDGNTVATRSTTDEIIERNSIPDNLVYHLQEATLDLQTGGDNKEWQSAVALELYSGNNDNGRILMYQPVDRSKIEFPVNETKSIGLTVHPNANANDLLLNNIKAAGGLRVRIYYYANIFSDAWKVNGVGLKLKFVDQNGVVYSASANTTPLDGRRSIDCANAAGILDGMDRKVMECYLNADFSSTSSAIKKN